LNTGKLELRGTRPHPSGSAFFTGNATFFPLAAVEKLGSNSRPTPRGWIAPRTCRGCRTCLGFSKDEPRRGGCTTFTASSDPRSIERRCESSRVESSRVESSRLDATRRDAMPMRFHRQSRRESLCNTFTMQLHERASIAASVCVRMRARTRACERASAWTQGSGRVSMPRMRMRIRIRIRTRVGR